MSKRRIRIGKLRKKVEPLQPLEQKQGLAQQVAPQDAFRHVQRNSNALTTADLRTLQRTMGNRMVRWMMAQRTDSTNGKLQHTPTVENAEFKVQTKLTVGASDDVYEQEADRVARQVMMPDGEAQVTGDRPSIRRKMGDGHDLTAARFAGDETLEGCYDGEKSQYLRSGSTGEAVKKIQQALIDLGYPMPISTKKTGSPDGIYGTETKGTVRQFQIDQSLKGKEGVVGAETMAAFDKLLGSGITPSKEKPEIEATEKAMGQHVADKMDTANKGTHTADEGIHYARNYRDAFPARWKEDYMNGYADPNYFVRVGFMDWVLKPGVSASAAIKSWLKGLTIAECFTTVVAIEYDTIRAAIGDKKFDELFGSTEKALALNKRLHIAPPPTTLPLDEYMKPTEAAAKGEEGTINHRPVKVGEWYYFYNHPKYLVKHPAGEWQGENSIYMGKDAMGNQLWSGLGTVNTTQTDSKVTEDEMLGQMVDAYNFKRDADDEKELKSVKAANGGVLPKKYVFESEGGELPEKIDKNRILNDPPYEHDGTTRKGGFSSGAGQTLDVDKIKGLRDKP